MIDKIIDKIVGFVATIALLVLLCSGVFTKLLNFILWLLMLQNSQPETSLIGEIIVRVLTFATSYSLVGLIFNAMELFSKKLMSFAYFIISTLLGFAIAYIVWVIEQHVLIITIILASLTLASVVYIIIRAIYKIQKNKKITEYGRDN